jgi:hypothetical protein
VGEARGSARAPEGPDDELRSRPKAAEDARKGRGGSPKSLYLQGMGKSFDELFYKVSKVRYIRRMDRNTDSLNNNSTNAVSVVYEFEPWMSKQQLANHLSMSVRWIEMCVREGMPMMRFGNRPRFRASEVEDWISKHAKGTRQ